MKAALTAVALWAAAVPSWAVVVARPSARASVVAALPAAVGRPALLGSTALTPSGPVPTLAVPADAPLLPPSARSPLPAPLGVAGPGVTPEHAEAIQRLADETGRPWFVFGSRQTGVRFQDGTPFTEASDLNLGVVGGPEAAAAAAAVWDGVPGARRAPLTLPTVEEAVGRGHLVFKPRAALHPDEVAALAAPLRTENQLARLQERPRAKGESFRFTVIGDAEPGRFWFSRLLFGAPGVFWKLLYRAELAKTDFILQLGDLVSRGLREKFRAVFRGLRAMKLRTPLLTVIGNHDRHRPHGVSHDRLFRRYWGDTDWVLDRGDWRFVVVDNSAGRLTDEQLEWLERSLEPGRRLIVFIHIPPAPLGVFTDYGGLKGAGGFKQGSEAFMRLMSERRVERVYMGHVHGLAAVTRDGVRYVLTGGGGSPLYPNAAVNLIHHFLEVEVGPSGVKETVHPLEGKPFPL